MQPLHIQDRDDKPALLAALSAATRAAGKHVIAVPGTDQALTEATKYTTNAKNIFTAEKMLSILTGLDDPSQRPLRERTIGALLIVDDAEHLDPEQLRGLCEQAGKRNVKLLLTTTGAHRSPNAVGQPFIDTTHAHLPWARRLGDTDDPAPDTAITRARSHNINDREITEILARATQLSEKYEARHKPPWITRSRGLDRSNDGYGLDL